jgi:hypothetical protein
VLSKSTTGPIAVEMPCEQYRPPANPLHSATRQPSERSTLRSVNSLLHSSSPGGRSACSKRDAWGNYLRLMVALVAVIGPILSSLMLRGRAAAPVLGSGAASETHLAAASPLPTQTLDPRRTPVPDSLYPYPEQRVGFVSFGSEGLDIPRIYSRFIKLQDEGLTARERALGLESCIVLRVGTEFYEAPDPQTYRAVVADLVAENPGELWFIGNEPENPCRGNRFSGEYAQIYHDMYMFIKGTDAEPGLDPTAQVGIGGVVLPSSIRRRYLEKVLAAYENRYGKPMPIDVWNIHNLLLSECPGKCLPGDPTDPCPPEWRCSGGYVPRELWCDRGWYFSQADQSRSDLFRQLLVEFRQWMKDNGFRDKPLIITEMGVLANTVEGGCPGCYSHVGINQFMYETFDFMMNATDPEIGCPQDGYRLVQRWTWFTLYSNAYFNGDLFDGQGQMTDFGLNFANYLARFLPTAPTVFFVQRGWTGYTDDCDTWISPGAARPLQNTLSIAADGSEKAMLRFDLSVLPSDVEVVSATLSLRSAVHHDVGAMTVRCFGVRRPWEIADATWTNATQSTEWEVSGCDGVGDREREAADSVLVTADETTYLWDVTDLARRWVSDPSTNNGVILEGEADGTGRWRFRSSDQSESPPYWMHRYRPKLELAVQLPEPTQAATATPTLSETATPTRTVTPTPTRESSPTPTALSMIYLPIIRRLGLTLSQPAGQS